MNTTVLTIYCVAGFIVLAEALNKLERTAPLSCGPGWRKRATEWLKAIAWMLLAVGGAGALASPLMPHDKPSVQDICLVLGFAVLIVRTRVKEG
jgi:hypothetical protein